MKLYQLFDLPHSRIRIATYRRKKEWFACFIDDEIRKVGRSVKANSLENVVTKLITRWNRDAIESARNSGSSDTDKKT